MVVPLLAKRASSIALHRLVSSCFFVASTATTDVGKQQGYSAGYTLRVVGRVAAFTVGALFMTVQGASYLGYVDVNWAKIHKDSKKVRSAPSQACVQDTHSLPKIGCKQHLSSSINGNLHASACIHAWLDSAYQCAACDTCSSHVFCLSSVYMLAQVVIAQIYANACTCIFTYAGVRRYIKCMHA